MDPRWVAAAIGLVLAMLASGTAAPETPASAAPAARSAAPTPFTGGGPGCVVPDPTRPGGCLTRATAHALAEIDRAFGGYRKGPKILSAGCWDKHAWNPSSDHPRGRACDIYTSPSGQFASGTGLANGWELANWLRANAGPLRVKYLIWQGRYWEPGAAEAPGKWGVRYTGGGVYDPNDAVGGHYDHVHVSFQ